MNDNFKQIPILPSVEPLAERYEAFLTDIWGVLHNGLEAHPAACEALIRYRETGGISFLISNSPRPSGPVRIQMAELGVPRECYDGTITSGDVTRGLITAAAGKPIAHIGPDRDKPLVEGLDAWLVDWQEAELLILSGLYHDDTETPDDYADLLGKFLARGLPMVCANPDIQVEKGDKLVYCAGAIAQEYEKIGGKVVYAGKPYAPIFELAFAQISELAGRQVPKSKILMIGDGPKTDMLGAFTVGVDPLFIASGLTREQMAHGNTLDETTLNALFAGGSSRPVAAQTRLIW